MSLSQTLRALPEDAACAILGAALAEAGVPVAIASPIACSAPKVLAKVAELLEGYAAGQPLPKIERAVIGDDGADIGALVNATLDGDRPTSPGGDP